MKEKLHIAVLSLGICTLIGMTFAISSRDYKEKPPKLNSAPKSTTVTKKFVCSAEAIVDSSRATKEYNKNVDKVNKMLVKIKNIGGDDIYLKGPCEGLKGKARTECNINNVELNSLLRQVKKLEEKMIPYEECLEKLGIIGDANKENNGEADTTKKSEKKEEKTIINKKNMNTITSWSEGEWSTCSNDKQTRKVECESDGKKVDDNKCEGNKPVTTKVCKEINPIVANSDQDVRIENGNFVLSPENIPSTVLPPSTESNFGQSDIDIKLTAADTAARQLVTDVQLPEENIEISNSTAANCATNFAPAQNPVQYYNCLMKGKSETMLTAVAKLKTQVAQSALIAPSIKDQLNTLANQRIESIKSMSNATQQKSSVNDITAFKISIDTLTSDHILWQLSVRKLLLTDYTQRAQEIHTRLSTLANDIQLKIDSEEIRVGGDIAKVDTLMIQAQKKINAARINIDTSTSNLQSITKLQDTPAIRLKIDNAIITLGEAQKDLVQINDELKWLSIMDFFIQDVCLDAQGNRLIGVSPLQGDKRCVSSRDAYPGESISYWLADVPFAGKEIGVHRAQIAYRFPMVTSLTALRIHDTNQKEGELGTRDGFESIWSMYFQSENIISSGATSDQGGPNLFVGTGCQGDVTDPSARFNTSWSFVDRSIVPLGKTLTKDFTLTGNLNGNILVPGPCPDRKVTVEKRWELKKLDFNIRYKNARGKDIDVTRKLLTLVVSSKKGATNIHDERMYFTRELGQVRWESWENIALMSPKDAEEIRQKSLEMEDTGKCSDMTADRNDARLAEPISSNDGSNWVNLACTEATIIIPPRNLTNGDSYQSWIDYIKLSPLYAPLFGTNSVTGPSITELSASSAKPGETVTISGTNFGQQNIVQFNSKNASGFLPSSNNGTTISFTVPCEYHRLYTKMGNYKLSILNLDTNAHTSLTPFTVSADAQEGCSVKGTQSPENDSQ